MEKSFPIRILLAKPGLDGHDVGVKVIAHSLRNSGMEVIYTGLRQSVDQIISAADQEDVDVIGLSILSGSHLEISRKLLSRMREKGLDDIPVLVGGIIPREDIPLLKEIGVQEVFPVHTPLNEIVSYIQEQVPARRKKSNSTV
ncbi:MAG: cobalamin B12-binding domain-containing protein [Deltaproteobacteria bacterium]|nr:cobalamin B12-binding domain-containing protein [Deltaproteobacteria bacterium]